MEEAEALCSKMGIMVSGSFRCFGSSQYIKDKYGTGYEIEFKIDDINEIQIAQEIMDLGFGNS
jgi:ABC-type multidrug transport system ATPase subunit